MLLSRLGVRDGEAPAGDPEDCQMTRDNMKPERGMWVTEALLLCVCRLGSGVIDMCGQAVHIWLWTTDCTHSPEISILPENYVTAGQAGHWLCELTKPDLRK